MRIRSSMEIEQLRKYSDDLARTSTSAVAEARKDIDSAQHLLSRTPYSRRDLKEALKYIRLAVSALRNAISNSGRSEKMQRKALRSEKAAKKALLREEKLQLAQMKKAEPPHETEIILEPDDDKTSEGMSGEQAAIKPELVEKGELLDLVPAERDDR